MYKINIKNHLFHLIISCMQAQYSHILQMNRSTSRRCNIINIQSFCFLILQKIQVFQPNPDQYQNLILSAIQPHNRAQNYRNIIDSGFWTYSNTVGHGWTEVDKFILGPYKHCTLIIICLKLQSSFPGYPGCRKVDSG